MNALTIERRDMATQAVASLPMYDLPELQEANDALWRASEPITCRAAACIDLPSGRLSAARSLAGVAKRFASAQTFS